MLTPSAAAIDLEPILRDLDRDGYARLGRVMSDETLAMLQARSDAIMLGEVRYEGMFFQLDTSSGRYEDLTYGKGYEGPSLNYRKIEKLERDPLFCAWIENSLFERVVRARIEGAITIYRALMMAKAPHGGTMLPWHQDGGKFWGLSREPMLQIWTALDDAPIDAGCMDVFPRSHKDGLATPLGGVVPIEHVDQRQPEKTAVPLPARAGEVILLHNHTWHRSGVNTTSRPRRALTTCYMSAETRCLRKKKAPREFFRVFETRAPKTA